MTYKQKDVDTSEKQLSLCHCGSCNNKSETVATCQCGQCQPVEQQTFKEKEDSQCKWKYVDQRRFQSRRNENNKFIWETDCECSECSQ